MTKPPSLPNENAAFREVPRTGVIYVMTEAKLAGYSPESQAWANLGQGQPDTGRLPGSPDRREQLVIAMADQEYAPVGGINELRAAVADHYNRLFRRGRASKYTAENVAIAPGGRAALTRAAAALGNIHLGHFLPDYTAYEELLDVFRRFSPIPILLDPERGYEITPAELEREITGRGLGALLLSNPCNPTGKVLQGETLAAWTRMARELSCALLIDEFYSHYVWDDKDAQVRGANGLTAAKVSAAAFVDDVERDPVVIFDGLTKNWRYPGWRTAWALGPRRVIDAMASAGSFLDGGSSRPLQKAAIPLLEDDVALAEARAIQTTFRAKRELMVNGLRKLGIQIDAEPEGTFYVWADLKNLPSGLATGMEFFRRALAEQVICVPGEFFDVNPGKRRAGRPSRFRHHVRFSFGPAEGDLRRGLAGLGRVIA